MFISVFLTMLSEFGVACYIVQNRSALWHATEMKRNKSFSLKECLKLQNVGMSPMLLLRSSFAFVPLREWKPHLLCLHIALVHLASNLWNTNHVNSSTRVQLPIIRIWNQEYQMYDFILNPPGSTGVSIPYFILQYGGPRIFSRWLYLFV